MKISFDIARYILTDRDERLLQPSSKSSTLIGTFNRYVTGTSTGNSIVLSQNKGVPIKRAYYKKTNTAYDTKPKFLAKTT